MNSDVSPLFCISVFASAQRRMNASADSGCGVGEVVGVGEVGVDDDVVGAGRDAV